MAACAVTAELCSMKSNAIVTESNTVRAPSDELGTPVSRELSRCITLPFRQMQFYRKFVTLSLLAVCLRKI